MTPATSVDPGATVADVDTDIASATVSITGNFAGAQDELNFVDQLGIAGPYDAGTGVLSLSGTLSPADYRSALRSVKYRNTSDNPSTAARTVSFKVNDGVADSNVATKDVSVAAVNDAPVAVDGPNISTGEDTTTTTFLAPATLFNDTDAEGDPLTVSEVEGSAANVGVEITLAGGALLKQDANGQWRWKPNGAYNHLKAGETATSEWTYKANDGALDSNLAKNVITVNGANDAPVAVADSFDGVGNTALHVSESRSAGQAGKVINGDLNDNDTDPDNANSELSTTAETKATTGGGSVTIDSDGSFTFHPDDGDTTDSFSYTVSDGTATDTGTVTINMADEVWYVDNSAAPGGDGTSDTPFDTLAEADTASGAGDTVFVFDGNNTNVGLNAGITLADNQRLLGERADLVVGGHTLYPGVAGKRPSIGNAAADAVTLASGNTVRGLDIDASGTAIKGVSAWLPGRWTISRSTVRPESTL